MLIFYYVWIPWFTLRQPCHRAKKGNSKEEKKINLVIFLTPLTLMNIPASNLMSYVPQMKITQSSELLPLPLSPPRDANIKQNFIAFQHRRDHKNYPFPRTNSLHRAFTTPVKLGESQWVLFLDTKQHYRLLPCERVLTIFISILITD